MQDLTIKCWTSQPVSQSQPLPFRLALLTLLGSLSSFSPLSSLFIARVPTPPASYLPHSCHLFSSRMLTGILDAIHAHSAFLHLLISLFLCHIYISHHGAWRWSRLQLLVGQMRQGTTDSCFPNFLIRTPTKPTNDFF